MKVIPQPHHPGRWIIANPNGESIDGISYPNEIAAHKANLRGLDKELEPEMRKRMQPE